MNQVNASRSHSDKRPDILLVTNAYPFGEGEEFVEIELRKLAQFFDVSIFPIYCRGTRRPIDVAGVTTYQWDRSISRVIWSGFRGLISRNFWKDLFRAPSFLRFLANRRAPLRVLHSHAQAFYLKPHILRTFSDQDFSVIYSFWGTSGALCLARLPDSPPLVVRMHGHDLFHERNAGLVPGQTEIVASSSRILAVSRHGQNYLRRHYPEKAQMVDFVPIGVPVQPDNIDVRREDTLRLVSISYCVAIKRLHVILEAVRVCVSRGMIVHWTHIGGGALLPALKKQAHNWELDESVRFVGHLEPGWGGLYKHLSKHDYDLALNVSESEGLPIALQEALSFGIR